MKQIMIPYEEYLLLEKRDKDYYSLELGFKEISKMYNEVKTKNEKAIEKIQDYLCSYDYTSGEFKELPNVFIELLDILQGSDKE